MATIPEIATITRRDQITRPETIRQTLGLDCGGKVSFDLRGSELGSCGNDETPDDDPAFGSFLSLLESEIRYGSNLTTLPGVLVQAMMATLTEAGDMGADIGPHSMFPTQAGAR